MLGKWQEVCSWAWLSFPHTGWLAWPMHFLTVSYPAPQCPSHPRHIFCSCQFTALPSQFSSKCHWVGAGIGITQVCSFRRLLSQAPTQADHLLRYTFQCTLSPRMLPPQTFPLLTPEMLPHQVVPPPQAAAGCSCPDLLNYSIGKSLVDPGNPRCGRTWCR